MVDQIWVDELATLTKKDWKVLNKACDKRRRGLKNMHRLTRKLYKSSRLFSVRNKRITKSISRGTWKGARNIYMIRRMRTAAFIVTQRSRVVGAMIRVQSFGGAYYPLRCNKSMDLATAARFDHSRPLRAKAERAAEHYTKRRLTFGQVYS